MNYDRLFTMASEEPIRPGQSVTLKHRSAAAFIVAKLHIQEELLADFLILSIAVDDESLLIASAGVPATMWAGDSVVPPLRAAKAMCMTLEVKNVGHSPRSFVCDVLRAVEPAAGKLIYGFDSRVVMSGRFEIVVQPAREHMLERFIMSDATAAAVASLQVQVGDDLSRLTLMREVREPCEDDADCTSTGSFELAFRAAVEAGDDVRLFVVLKDKAAVRFVASAMGTPPDVPPFAKGADG